MTVTISSQLSRELPFIEAGASGGLDKWYRKSQLSRELPFIEAAHAIRRRRE